ncbi:unnamed protein product [Paramecium octaurelia]|uniref:Uncharacterized protein n=1 Tax=Paramecium octaurelia TaxID=43137 RepID=A0A8S1V190_PAROT|nr:unnamed protein product [Paramecium octaurelia]
MGPIQFLMILQNSNFKQIFPSIPFHQEFRPTAAHLQVDRTVIEFALSQYCKKKLLKQQEVFVKEFNTHAQILNLIKDTKAQKRFDNKQTLFVDFKCLKQYQP